MRRILIFGDSIAFGRGVKKTDSWAYKISRFFDAVSNEESLIFNLGIPSETSAGLGMRIEEEIKVRIRPKNKEDYNLVIIATGINDAKVILGKPRVSKKDFIRNITDAIDVAEKYSDKTVLVGPIKVRSRRTGQFKNKSIKEYNRLLKTICHNRKTKFIDLFGSWPLSSDDYYRDDGIHPSKVGHNYIAKVITNELASLQKEYIDPFPILRNELGLKDPDFEKLGLKESNIIHNDLFLGHINQNLIAPDVVLGGPCIRRDIDKEGISLNTFYQIFLPIKIASTLKKPCKIYLGLKEELILSPEHTNAYAVLANKLTRGIKKMASSLKADVSIINTADPSINKIIEETMKAARLNLSKEESEDLYRFSLSQNRNKEHIPTRILINKRVITCHSVSFLKKVTGCDTFLIVEDLEQIKTFLRAGQMNGGGISLSKSDFLTFLPLPNIFLSSTMFKAKPEGRIYLSRSPATYGDVWSRSCPASRRIYTALLELMGQKINRFNSNCENFISGMGRISRFFR